MTQPAPGTGDPDLPYGQVHPTADPGRPRLGHEGSDALRTALRRAVLLSLLACLGAAVVISVVAFLLVGWPGVWGAVLGLAVSLVFLGTTAAVGARTAGGDPVIVAGWVLGSWLVKIVVVGVALFLLKDATFYDPVALFAGIVVGMLITLGAEYRGLTGARVPYVDTSGR